MKVKAIEFVMNYESYVKEIESVVRTEFKPIIQKMLKIDPHDLITPGKAMGSGLAITHFQNNNAGRHNIWWHP